MRPMDISTRAAVAPTCAAVSAALDDPPAVDLSGRTPCEAFDVRALVEHLVGTSGALAALGRGEPLDPDDPWGGGAGAADGDWSARLRRNLDDLTQGWDRPAAWDGEAAVGGSSLPRAVLGEMALVEVALHGWDLARALGRNVALDPDVAAAVDRAVAGSADLGRQLGAYGPEVRAPADADDLDRALARSGRDPRWPS